jgi:hypothetical protein
MYEKIYLINMFIFRAPTRAVAPQRRQVEIMLC